MLFGDVNPSGKLPQTFPVRLEDNPAYINYPGDNGHVRYGEGIFVGYRYYEKKQVAPLFPFGFGLSYTNFAYGNLRLSADAIDPGRAADRHHRRHQHRQARRPGDRPAATCAMSRQSVARPEKELKGFAKLALAPGETKTASP